jgi:hypothetical protein
MGVTFEQQGDFSDGQQVIVGWPPRIPLLNCLAYVAKWAAVELVIRVL